jgi:hypothetical protein
LSINRWTSIQIIGGMLFKDNFSSNWWATLHLKDIFISSAWVTLWNMVMTFEWCYRIVAFEWMLEGCTHQDWLWDHLFWSSNVHFTAWIWVMNIIDDANAFLFTIWFDKLGGIHGEELWAYNDEPFTAKYEMHVRTTWQFHEGWWPHILEGYVSTVGKFMTNWQSWWVLAWCTQSIRG